MRKFIPLLIPILLVNVAYTQSYKFDPPWNPPLPAGVSFTVKGVDNLPDIYGDINDPQLVIFMGGNQFMVLDELIPAFKKKHPEYERILVETFPPGLLMQQIKTGSLLIGNMRITVKADIYTTAKNKIMEFDDMFERTTPFAATKLALMVHKGNPKQVKGLSDLLDDKIRISMPNKKIEGIGKNIEDAYLKAGGEKMHKKIMETKVKNGTTYLTQIHHRQSPMRILYKQSDVAPVWETEIIYQKSVGNPVEQIDIPIKYNTHSVSAAGLLKEAAHKQAAKHFMDFLESEQSKNIFKKFGFLDAQ